MTMVCTVELSSLPDRVLLVHEDPEEAAPASVSAEI